MSDRPIFFSAPMIRALLDGRKTQTRRALRPQPINSFLETKLPYAPGDRLWVREGGELLHDAEDWNGEDRWYVAGWRYVDGSLKEFRDFGVPLSEWVGDCSAQRRSPIHMPRWASRLTLLVTDVRVQRLQEISEEDAMAEGASSRPACSGPLRREAGWSMDWSRVGELSRYAIRPPGGPAKAPLRETDISLCDPQMAFASYWNSIHGPDAWGANPWVAAISFEVKRGNIDEVSL